jgi:SAM-dependent methyltransferase
MTRSPGEYVLDTAARAERDRLRVSAHWWDPFTIRRLDAIGVGPGWRCLEIGAGTGSIAAWLQRRVGRDGHVVATDIETRWLDDLAQPNLEVRHHNVASEPLDFGYDLVHARLVLEHLPQRRAVASKLARTLRPGGWLVVEDYDLCTVGAVDPPSTRWTNVNAVIAAAMQASGFDPSYGSRIPGDLLRAGLVDVAAEGTVYSCPVAAMRALFRPVVARIGARAVETGALAPEDLAYVVGLFDGADPSVTAYTPILVSARGRSPTPG